MSLPLQFCHGPIDNSVMSLNVWVSRLPVFIPPNLKAFLIRYLIHWFDPMVLTRSSRDQNTSNQGSAQVISSNQGSLDCFPDKTFISEKLDVYHRDHDCL